MNKKTAHVLQGFLLLSDEEKKEIIEQIEEYKKYPITAKGLIQKSLKEHFGMESHGISLGPSPNSCPCCGK